MRRVPAHYATLRRATFPRRQFQTRRRFISTDGSNRIDSGRNSTSPRRRQFPPPSCARGGAPIPSSLNRCRRRFERAVEQRLKETYFPGAVRQASRLPAPTRMNAPAAAVNGATKTRPKLPTTVFTISALTYGLLMKSSIPTPLAA